MSSYWNIFKSSPPKATEAQKKAAKKKVEDKMSGKRKPKPKPKPKPKKKAKKKNIGVVKAAKTIMSHKDKAY